jgi:hypothetical protein
MRRGSLFWGTLLILAGVFFLLDSLNIVNINVWGLIWPFFLISVGVWFLLGRRASWGGVESESVSIPLEGAQRAHMKMRHGAGVLRIGSGAEPGSLMTGTFEGGLDHQSRKSGDSLEVEIRVPRNVFNFFPGTLGMDWSVKLNNQVELSLDVGGGANEAKLDLSDLKVTNLVMKTGASGTEITMPAKAGHTKARVESGVASVTISFPDGVAGSIQARGDLADISVDTQRFPRSGDTYKSANYDEAENKIDLHVKTDVGSVKIR